MGRISVFFPADNEKGYVQAVISDEDAKSFEAIGFSLTADGAKKPATKSTKSSKKAVADGGDTN